MTLARHERLTRYAVAASVVPLGSIATADIIHRVVNHSLAHVDHGQFFINVVSGNTFTDPPDSWASIYGGEPSPSCIGFSFSDRDGSTSAWLVAAGHGLFGTNPPLDRRLQPEGVVIDDQPDIAQGRNSWDWLATAYPGSDLDFNGAADVNVPAYIGFAIDDPDDSVGVLYGWAQIMIRESGGLHNNRFTLDIIDYAYDDTGAAIATGQTEATAIPGAGGLVALACGAAGLRRRRNRATTSATAETA